MQQRNKLYEREMKCTLRELPYFNIRGDISIYHGRFNNSLICNKKSRRSLESLPSLNDLFSLNSANNSLNTDSDSFSFILVDIIHHTAFRKSNLVEMNTTYQFFTVILGVLD